MQKYCLLICCKRKILLDGRKNTVDKTSERARLASVLLVVHHFSTGKQAQN
jgi:hypothetical protein